MGPPAVIPIPIQGGVGVHPIVGDVVSLNPDRQELRANDLGQAELALHHVAMQDLPQITPLGDHVEHHPSVLLAPLLEIAGMLEVVRSDTAGQEDLQALDRAFRVLSRDGVNHALELPRRLIAVNASAIHQAVPATMSGDGLAIIRIVGDHGDAVRRRHPERLTVGDLTAISEHTTPQGRTNMAGQTDLLRELLGSTDLCVEARGLRRQELHQTQLTRDLTQSPLDITVVITSDTPIQGRSKQIDAHAPIERLISQSLISDSSHIGSLQYTNDHPSQSLISELQKGPRKVEERYYRTSRKYFKYSLVVPLASSSREHFDRQSNRLSHLDAFFLAHPCL